METFRIAAQIVISLVILNVWLVRFGKPTPFRAGAAGNMREEFAAYGLPVWFMWVIGTFKTLLALMLLAGIWWAPLVPPSALGMAALMGGAIAMHIKVKDPLKKALPAACLLILSVAILTTSRF